MKQLGALLADVDFKLVQGDLESEVPAIAFDSRKVEAGGLFTAIPGFQVDGHQFISQALDKGVKTIVCEKLPEDLSNNVNCIQVNNAGKAMAIIAHNFYDRPSEELALVGITGTNGKTTTATLLYNLYQNMNYPAGLLSTNGVRIGTIEKEATHTTPDPVHLCRALREMVEHKIRYAFIEVSSHALDQERVAGLQFAGAVFTNISHEHLDYHKTFDNYLKAKKRLFDDLPKDAFALVNTDDKQGEFIVQNCHGRIKTFALKRMADYKARILENDFTGMRLELNGNEVYCPITGRFNAYNLLATYGTSLELGMQENTVLQGLSSLKPVKGRLEMVENAREITGIVDYAHSPDALQNLLTTISEANQQQGKIFTVIGCGGDRDKKKRPEMAKIALHYSDKIILTSDNPRNEDPEAIIREMETGIPESEHHKALAITNREQAIKTATSLARKGDIILVAGKGHEKYQEVKGEKKPFDDKALLNQFLKPDEGNLAKNPINPN